MLKLAYKSLRDKNSDLATQDILRRLTDLRYAILNKDLARLIREEKEEEAFASNTKSKYLSKVIA
ncbi:hypothetical protein [Staphylococcus sp. GDY8P19P]|uniref:hypothetical protein n=1 Tax=Staphylococcus sp. GDY8P19P TaxID=2804415 RepID=UPI0019511049|nr:hypothetical protein [Staphylococcus sp. GDY8P19P]